MSHLNSNINETFIIEPMLISGDTIIYSACSAFYTNNIVSCDSISSIYLGDIYVEINVPLVPNTDNTLDIGLINKRFRSINTVSGSSTYWTSQNGTINSLSASTINLGLDLSNNERILTAETVILGNDTLISGFF